MSEHPALYEAFARHWAPRGLAAVPDGALDRLRELGFDYLWLMGVWTTGELGRSIARRIFADKPATAIESSPYAIARYEVDPRYGGNDALAELRKRLAKRHIGLILDFVPNHTARDHDWIRSHPDIYVHDGRGLAVDGVGSVAATGMADPAPDIACGKDPHFPAWADTAQLDHRLHTTWIVLVETLQRIATQCDGVRCDMAMLVLSDVFAKTWAHAPPRKTVPDMMFAREEFWAAAIDQLPKPFLWIAEAYWGLENRLQNLGFDFTYDKTLYDHLLHGTPAQILGDLEAPLDVQRRSVRFLENHDEPRLARSLPRERAAAALVIAMTTPGLRFVHDGQIEGRQVQATIQLAQRPDEAADPLSREIHDRLLAIPRDGSFEVLATTNERLIAYRWDGEQPVVVVVNYTTELISAHVTLDLHGIGGRRIALHDVIGAATYERNGSAPLHVVLRPWQAHVFTVTTMGLWHD